MTSPPRQNGDKEKVTFVFENGEFSHRGSAPYDCSNLPPQDRVLPVSPPCQALWREGLLLLGGGGYARRQSSPSSSSSSSLRKPDFLAGFPSSLFRARVVVVMAVGLFRIVDLVGVAVVVAVGDSD